MIGTVFNRNVLHRLGDAINAWKGLPTPSQLYPPQMSMQGGFTSFPGYDVLAREGGSRDEARVKKALLSPTVFANVQAIANEIASAEIVVKERVSDTLEDVDNHPLELLWEAPNPHMGRSFLMSYWAWSYTLASRAYLYWLPAQGEIQEVWPIPPFMIRPLPSTQDFIGGYAFKARPDTDPILIPSEYITYSHSVNLFDIRDGLSFLAAAMVDINSEIAEALWNQNFFDEGNGVPDGLITVGKDTLDIDLMRIRSELRDFFGGTRRGVAVARAGDMDWKPFGRSQKDVEFKEGLALAAQRIGRAMGFPDGYWSDIANKANAEAARATMIAGAVWPLLVRLHEDMNAGIIKRWYGEQYRAQFKDIRPEDRTLILKELDAHKSHWTIDELREADGKEPIGDVRGLMLVAELAKGVATPASKPSQVTEDYLAEQEAALAPPEEEAPAEAPPPEAKAEPPPPILGYHIEQGVVSRNEARERLSLPSEDETESQKLRALTAQLAVIKAATEAGIALDPALQLVGLDVPKDTATPEPVVRGSGFGGQGSSRTPNPQSPIPPPAQAPPIGEAPASGEAPAGGGGVPEEAPMKAIDDEDDDFDRLIASPRSQRWLELKSDLVLWQRKATKALRAGKSAAVKFESASIPADEHARISTALVTAQTAADVAQAFKATDETDSLISQEWDAATAWAREAAKGDEG